MLFWIGKKILTIKLFYSGYRLKIHSQTFLFYFKLNSKMWTLFDLNIFWICCENTFWHSGVLVCLILFKVVWVETWLAPHLKIKLKLTVILPLSRTFVIHKSHWAITVFFTVWSSCRPYVSVLSVHMKNQMCWLMSLMYLFKLVITKQGKCHLSSSVRRLFSLEKWQWFIMSNDPK